MNQSNKAFQDFKPAPQLKKKYYIISACLIYGIFLFFGGPFLILILNEIVNNGNNEAINFLIPIGYALTGFTVIYLLSILFTSWYFQTISYKINETEIHVFRGLITKSHKIVPFRTITNIDIKRGILDRLTGIGTIEIQTAGSSGPKMSPEEMINGIILVDIEPLREWILIHVRGLIGGSAGTTQDLEQVSDYTILSDILGELKHIRADFASR